MRPRKSLGREPIPARSAFIRFVCAMARDPVRDEPPTIKGRHHETRARGLRQFAGLTRDDQPLDPFKLAKYAKLFVAPFEAVEGLSQETKEHLLGPGSEMWSGGAASLPLPDGKKLIILNPKHSPLRQRATLMEEISHVFLGHKPSRLAVEQKGIDGKTRARDYNAAIEEEAYGTGTAALVPYAGLKSFIEQGKTAAEIARHYGVSRPLVEYRIKVSRLWQTYSENIFRTFS